MKLFIKFDIKIPIILTLVLSVFKVYGIPPFAGWSWWWITLPSCTSVLICLFIAAAVVEFRVFDDDEQD